MQADFWSTCINLLITSMKGVVEEFHKNKSLIVDMNEYNFLVKDKYLYRTGSFQYLCAILGLNDLNFLSENL